MWGSSLSDQDTIAYEIFNANSLEFAVMADGRLFHTPDGGGDLVSTVRDDGGSGLGFAGLWLTDLTPGESLQYAEHSKIDEDSYTLNHTLSLDYYVYNDWFEDFESLTASLYLEFLPACGGGFIGSRPTKDMIYHYAPNYYQDCTDRRPNIVACRGLNKPYFSMKTTRLSK